VQNFVVYRDMRRGGDAGGRGWVARCGRGAVRAKAQICGEKAERRKCAYLLIVSYDSSGMKVTVGGMICTGSLGWSYGQTREQAGTGKTNLRREAGFASWMELGGMYYDARRLEIISRNWI
jgi:hypothetical protein